MTDHRPWVERCLRLEQRLHDAECVIADLRALLRGTTRASAFAIVAREVAREVPRAGTWLAAYNAAREKWHGH